MLLFTVKKGNLPKTVQNQEDLPRGIEFAFYLNVLGVIVLAGPKERFSDQASDDKAEDFGVDVIKEELEADEESDNGAIDEPFL